MKKAKSTINLTRTLSDRILLLLQNFLLFPVIVHNRTNALHSGMDDNEYKFSRRFESKELKMVRVAVSSFYDYLTVVLKTFQEFDTTI